MCLYPRLIKNRKYVPNKKNGGKPPPVPDERVRWVPVGCQRCIECRKQKARGWRLRLLEDIRHNRTAKFITLTFSNESIQELCKLERLKELTGYELDNEIATVATRLFLERWRKKYKRSLRHWLVTEIGHNGTENIHLHGIVWTEQSLTKLEEIWSYGYVWKGKKENGKLINYVSDRTINYIVKYVTKIDEKHKNFTSKVLTSKGIGNGYTNRMDANRNKYKGKDTKETYKTREGYEIAMPIYWRNKIYTEKEREQLWLNRLDKNERWICGERIRADDTDAYYKTLNWYRRINIQLGYGTDEKDWSQEQYELERRKMNMAKRLNKANEKLVLTLD